MSGLHALKDLVKSKQERLDVVSKKLSLERGGINEKLKFKNKVLKKGKEKRLENLKLELEGVEQRFQREKEQLQNKIKAYEDKLEVIEKTHSNRIQTYYNPLMNSLYESDEEVSEEDISLPLAYHKLKAESDELTLSITRLTQTIKAAEEKELNDMRASYAAKIAQPEVKPKKVIKLAKKAVTPLLDDEQIRLKLGDEWLMKRKRIIHGKEALPPKDDPYWAEATIYHLEGYTFENVSQARQHQIEERQREQEIEDAERRQQEEQWQIRKLERAKMGLGLDDY